METVRSVTQSILIRKVRSHAVQGSGDLVVVCQPSFLGVWNCVLHTINLVSFYCSSVLDHKEKLIHCPLYME